MQISTATWTTTTTPFGGASLGFLRQPLVAASGSAACGCPGAGNIVHTGGRSDTRFGWAADRLRRPQIVLNLEMCCY